MLFLSKYADWPRRPRWFTWPVIAWALYDLASTLYSFCVVSRYFPLWVTSERGAPLARHSFAMSLSVAAAALIQMTLGPISDESGKRKIFVLGFTLMAVIFTAAIGWAGSLNEGLLFFMLANIGAQCAFVFYNAMLADVADDRHLARISGIGTGVGYMGTLIGVLFVSRYAGVGVYTPIFVPTAALFLAFSLPLFFFVREQPQLHRGSFGEAVRNSWNAMFLTLRRVAARREILLFFVAVLIGLEATQTSTQYMAIYAKEVVHLSEVKGSFLGLRLAEMDVFFLVTAVFALLGAFIVGHLGDKWGHWRMLLVVMGIWVTGLGLGTLDTSKKVFYVVGFLIAVGYGGIWTVSRSFLMAVCHPEEKSQMFAIFGVVNKGAAIFGPLIWAGTMHLAHRWPAYEYRAALASMGLLMLIGLLVMSRVRLEPRPLELFPNRLL